MPQAPKFKERLPSGVVGVNIRSAAVQLKECLHLENNPEIFNQIRSNLQELGKKHLVSERAPSEQQDALTTVKAELRDQYPDIFDSEDKERRLYLAVRVIYQQHAWRVRLHRHHGEALSKKGSRKRSKFIGHGRSDIKTAKNSSKNKTKSVEKIRNGVQEENIPKKTNRSAVLLSPENRGLEEHSSRPFVRYKEPLVPSQAVNQPTESVTSTQPASATRAMPVTPPLVNSASQPSSQRSDMSGSSTTSKSLQDIVLADRRPSNSNAPPPAHISSDSHNTMGERQLGTGGTQAVFNFLEHCTPSMAHLHRHFVNFGCSNEEYLLAVSSWPPEVVRNFLTQALTDRETGEVLVNPMDMFVLQTHFLAYYQM